MDYIDAPPRQTRLLLYTTASAIAMATDGKDAVELDLSLLEPRRQPSPGAQKQAVAELLARTMTALDAVIRSQTAPPRRTSPAVLGRKLTQRGERTEVVLGRERRYAPGGGFQTLLEAAIVDAAAEAEKS